MHNLYTKQQAPTWCTKIKLKIKQLYTTQLYTQIIHTTKKLKQPTIYQSHYNISILVIASFCDVVLAVWLAWIGYRCVHAHFPRLLHCRENWKKLMKPVVRVQRAVHIALYSSVWSCRWKSNSDRSLPSLAQLKLVQTDQLVWQSS